jgi:molecular chaperone GrpE
MDLSKENMDTASEETVVAAEEECAEQDTETLKKQNEELEDKYMRLAAEYDNYQKRTQREKDALYADAVIDTAAQILSVQDNLDRALAVEIEGEEAKRVLEGIQMVSKQLKDILSKMQITEIEAEGKPFDPNYHNAVMHVDDDSVGENTVVEELMKGYIYKDSRVVRHSMVKVAN